MRPGRDAPACSIPTVSVFTIGASCSMHATHHVLRNIESIRSPFMATTAPGIGRPHSVGHGTATGPKASPSRAHVVGAEVQPATASQARVFTYAQLQERTETSERGIMLAEPCMRGLDTKLDNLEVRLWGTEALTHDLEMKSKSLAVRLRETEASATEFEMNSGKKGRPRTTWI